MNKITGALIDEATHIRAIAKDVVLSGTYFYPIKVRHTQPPILYHPLYLLHKPPHYYLPPIQKKTKYNE